MKDAAPEKASERIRLFTASWCAHAISVEAFLDRHEIEVERINIDRDPEARSELIALNGGYASVPTLLFPDGTKLTEPSFGQLRTKLGLGASRGLVDSIRGILGRKDRETGA